MHTARLKKLVNNLGHHDSSKRRSAAEALSEGDERAVYPLIKALRDENFGVQDAAIRSLIEIKGESTAYMLLPLLRENAFLRNTAIMIIKEVGREAVPLLAPLLKDHDDDVRKFALDLIQDIKYCDYPEKLVDRLENDLNPNVRAAAAKALGALKYRAAEPQLMDALRDEEWVCFSAIEALTDLEPEDERCLHSIAALLNSPSEAIRFAALEALGKIGSPLSAKPIVDHISKTDGYEKNAAIKSLVRIGDIPLIPGISANLIELLRDGDWEDRLIAMKGLVALKEKSAIPYMIDIAGSYDASVPDNEEKVFIIREAVKNFGCNKYLLDILNDGSMKFRGRSIAVDIIGDLNCREAVPALIKLLKDQCRDVKRSAVNSLAKTEGDETKESLIDSINEHDSHVRKTAVISLGKIREKDAFEPLMKFLHTEKYHDVICEFVKSLLNINPSLFLSRIDEYSADIREIAAGYVSDIRTGVSC